MNECAIGTLMVSGVDGVGVLGMPVVRERMGNGLCECGVV